MRVVQFKSVRFCCILVFVMTARTPPLCSRPTRPPLLCSCPASLFSPARARRSGSVLARRACVIHIRACACVCVRVRACACVCVNVRACACVGVCFTLWIVVLPVCFTLWIVVLPGMRVCHVCTAFCRVSERAREGERERGREGEREIACPSCAEQERARVCVSESASYLYESR